MVLPTIENLFNTCCLNLDVLNSVDQPLISPNEPLNVSPTNKLDDDKDVLNHLIGNFDFKNPFSPKVLLRNQTTTN